MYAAVKKDIGLEDKLASRKGVVDDLKSISASNVVYDMFELYEKVVRDCKDKRSFTYNDMDDLIVETCSNSEINGIISLIKMEEINKRTAIVAGKFVSMLIQKSFDDGNNNFDIKDCPYIDFPYSVSGTETELLKIKVGGKLSDFVGLECNYVDMELHGSAKSYCGKSMRNSHLKIYGNVQGYWFAERCESSIVELHGRLIDFNALIGKRAKHNIFKTDNKQTLYDFKTYLPKKNRIVFIDNGVEEIVRDYAGSS
tara:strand:- start:10726 stop:11490 length:765 start_codon:yes stop_codon:yes gene_type:complete